MVVAVDAGGGLAGTGMGTLLEKFYPIFGGKEHTGFALFPADGGVMLFNSPRGSARVWPEGPQNLPPPQPRKLDLARVKGAASWGKQQALFVLEHLEQLRTGKATLEEHIRCYWEDARQSELLAGFGEGDSGSTARGTRGQASVETS